MDTDEFIHLEALIASASDGVSREEWHGFSVVIFKEQWGVLVLSEWGAQVLWYQPAGQEHPVLWVTATPAPHPRPIRGGIPLCWPWFGDHPSEAFLPAHGVARTARWNITRKELEASSVFIELQPEETPLWNSVDVSLQVQANGSALTLLLASRNLGAEPVELTQALHTYLAISSRANVHIASLDNVKYADKLANYDEFVQQGDLHFDQAIDRIYQSVETVYLHDQGWQRLLEVGKLSSASTVIWNPADAGARMADIGADQVDQFVCVESARTPQFDRQTLAAGESVTLGTRLKVINL
jgi:glucose-6-phosphate 1-epimerase